MTRKPLLIGTAALACTLGAALVVPPAASAAAPRDRVVDRAFVDCSRGAMLQVDLEREWRKFEVDLEIYSNPRERWTITIGAPGRVTHTLTRSTNREGELNAWRYMSASNRTIEVRATSAGGETCRATVRG
jgi:hypothetical protein